MEKSYRNKSKSIIKSNNQNLKDERKQNNFELSNKKDLEYDIEELKKYKRNLRLYPIYTMFAYDLLFFYAIRMMFLTEVKNISDSQVVLSLSLFAIFTVIMQFPATLLVSKIGNKHGAIVGNILNVIWCILFMFIQNNWQLQTVTIITATANSIKNITDSNILNESIPNSSKKNDIFTSIDKRGYYQFCIISAISTIVAGYLYEINPYIPLFLCLICNIIATYLSFNFENVKQEKEVEVKDYISELKHGFRFTFRSKRLKALLITTGVIWGIIILLGVYELALLQNIGASSSQIGIIFAILELIKGLSSKKAISYNNKFKNKSLTNILLSFGTAFIIAGCIAIFNISFITKFIIIIAIFLAIGAIIGIYIILSKRYLNSFANEKISTSIYAARSISDNVSRTIIAAIGSYLLTITNINVATIISGILIMFTTLFLSLYMKDKLGLPEEQYTQKDIYIR